MTTPVIGQVFLTPAALQSIAVELWGEEKWRGAFQSHLGISYSQLHRYMTVYNGQRIPQTLAMVMHLLKVTKDAGIEVPPLPMYPASELKPVKFVWEKKEKPERPNNDAPEEDFFGLGDAETEAPAPEPETQQEAAPVPEPAAPAKPSRKRAMGTGPAKAEAGPVKGRAGAPKPSLAKASAKLGKALTPKKTTKAAKA